MTILPLLHDRQVKSLPPQQIREGWLQSHCPVCCMKEVSSLQPLFGKWKERFPTVYLKLRRRLVVLSASVLGGPPAADCILRTHQMSDTRCPTEPGSGGTGMSPVLSPTNDVYLLLSVPLSTYTTPFRGGTYMRRSRSRSVGDTEGFVVGSTFSRCRSLMTCCMTRCQTTNFST